MLATSFSSKGLSYKIFVESLSGWKTAIFQRIAETGRQRLQRVRKSSSQELRFRLASSHDLHFSSFTAESHIIRLLHPNLNRKSEPLGSQPVICRSKTLYSIQHTFYKGFFAITLAVSVIVLFLQWVWGWKVRSTLRILSWNLGQSWYLEHLDTEPERH